MHPSKDPAKDSLESPRSYSKTHHARSSLRSRIARAREHISHKGYTSVPQTDVASTSTIQIGISEAAESSLEQPNMPDSPTSNPSGSPANVSSTSLIDSNLDGSSSDKREVGAWANHAQPPIGAIFVHAGAGYHSTTNEHIHLGACADAAKMAMHVLRGGGSAVEAVEAAIRVLEDKEITNAGYGSNLTIEGVVECDATVVDHLGRSGACGAVAKIKNPIHLARVILEQSSRPLSLRRVPPNLLIADGAAEFGWEHGIDIVPHESLVSKNARDRFVRWKEDLRRAGGPRGPGTPNSMGSGYDEPIDHDFEEKLRAHQRRDHYNALLNGTWNEGQPDSPNPLSASTSPALPEAQTYFEANLRSGTGSKKNSRSSSPITARGSSPSGRPPPSKRPRIGGSQSSDNFATRVQSLLSQKAKSTMITPQTAPPDNMVNAAASIVLKSKREARQAGGSHDGSVDATRVQSLLPQKTSAKSGMIAPRTGPPDNMVNAAATIILKAKREARQAGGSHDGSVDDSEHCEPSHPIPSSPMAKAMPPDKLPGIDEDLITDTVGAIAIDMFGNIAAGSSSGGIGMKHRGRVGPAALVGVGTAVIPVDIEDTDNVCVAAVTSGTGEHMATTMASQKCAERLYFNTKRGRGGANAPATEEEAMDSFVLYDFMDHPGVKGSHSAGAIGVMAVKKTEHGYFLHFAHNTDSFALASMASNDKEPRCVMSRLGDHGSVVQGGRKIRME